MLSRRPHAPQSCGLDSAVDHRPPPMRVVPGGARLPPPSPIPSQRSGTDLQRTLDGAARRARFQRQQPSGFGNLRARQSLKGVLGGGRGMGGLGPKRLGTKNAPIRSSRSRALAWTSGVPSRCAAFAGAGPMPVVKCRRCQADAPLVALQARPKQWLRPLEIRDDVTLQFGGTPWKVIREEARYCALSALVPGDSRRPRVSVPSPHAPPPTPSCPCTHTELRKAEMQWALALTVRSVSHTVPLFEVMCL